MRSVTYFILGLGILASLFLCASVWRLWALRKQAKYSEIFALTIPVVASAVLLIPSCVFGMVDPDKSLLWLSNGGAEVWLVGAGICSLLVAMPLMFMTKSLLMGIHILENGGPARPTWMSMEMTDPWGVRVGGVFAMGIGVVCLVVS